MARKTERERLEHSLQMQLVTMSDANLETLIADARAMNRATHEHLESFAACDPESVNDRATQIDHLAAGFHGLDHDAVVDMSPKERIARHHAAHGYPWLLAQFTREQAESVS